jgi:hypothetical protein
MDIDKISISIARKKPETNLVIAKRNTTNPIPEFLSQPAQIMHSVLTKLLKHAKR